MPGRVLVCGGSSLFCAKAANFLREHSVSVENVLEGDIATAELRNELAYDCSREKFVLECRPKSADKPYRLRRLGQAEIMATANLKDVSDFLNKK